LHLDEIDLKDIMTHRSDVFAIDINENVKEIIKKIAATTFTKVPFYDKSDDKIIGYLKVIDLMRELYKNEKDYSKINIRDLLIAPWYLPGDSSIGRHLQEFKNKGNTIAFVVDEYGGFMGIVTLEDVVEEIVGDINSDNKDDNMCKVVKNEDGSFVVNADVNLLDANEQIGSKFEDKEVSTIGGFLLNRIEKIPNKGEEFVVDDYIFKILDAKDTSIEKISIVKNNNIKFCDVDDVDINNANNGKDLLNKNINEKE
jgi:CBS domain containing-hemolysin-like protein